MKRTIRLTEADLHRVIKESVKQCLTELDWKTYASAADKARKRYEDSPIPKSRKEWDRSREFDAAASRELSDKHGRNLKTWGDMNGNRTVMDADAPWTTGSNEYGSEPLGYYYTSSPKRDWRNGASEIQDGDLEVMGDIPIDIEPSRYISKEECDARNRDNMIGREIDDYVHGRNKYIKGKGWSN